MWRASRSFSRKRSWELRYWTAALLVMALLVYAGVRLIPPPPPPVPAAPSVVDVQARVVAVVFEEPAGPKKININRATAQELEALPGIGPALAARIVAYRETYGPFRSVDDLLKVSGIGPATLSRIRDLIAVEDEP